MKKPATKTRDSKWYEGTNGPQNQSRSTFVQSTLTDEEKAHCKAQNWSWADFGEQLPELLASGYKFTVSVDTYNDAIAAWMIAVGDNHQNKGLILSGRGPTAEAAVGVLLYKHFTKFGGVWPRDDSGQGRDKWA